MIDAGGPDARHPEPNGRTAGGGHIFTLYVASQDPVPPPEDRELVEPVASLGFLRTDEEGPSGP